MVSVVLPVPVLLSALVEAAVLLALVPAVVLCAELALVVLLVDAVVLVVLLGAGLRRSAAPVGEGAAARREPAERP